ncbi:MAG: hypothetical protein DMF62_09090 [Acidobacteria bacterium]|nr:MAG: hypothetical protein DMF62_09090 [Acidobacteriota bacterium]
MKSSFVIISLTVFFAATALLVAAQPPAPAAVTPLPFTTGEKLTYEGKINKFAVSVTIGDMIFHERWQAPL